MIACVPLNGLVFLLPGLIMGILVVLVVVLRRLWVDAVDEVDDLYDTLDAQSDFMLERGIHWGWWDRIDPWSPASEVADSDDQSYSESATITQEAS